MLGVLRSNIYTCHYCSESSLSHIIQISIILQLTTLCIVTLQFFCLYLRRCVSEHLRNMCIRNCGKHFSSCDYYNNLHVLCMHIIFEIIKASISTVTKNVLIQASEASSRKFRSEPFDDFVRIAIYFFGENCS